MIKRFVEFLHQRSRIEMKSLFIALLSSMLFHVISAKPDGAPPGACKSMTPDPSGHGASPQTTASPYTVYYDKDNFKVGQPVNITIKGSSSNMFKGILVQVRKDDNPIGTFVTLPAGVKDLMCNNANNSVTHDGTNKNGWKTIMLQWLPPANVTTLDNLKFLATVVEKRVTFWVKIKGKPMSTMPTEGPPKVTTTNSVETTSRPSLLFASIVMMISAYIMRL